MRPNNQKSVKSFTCEFIFNLCFEAMKYAQICGWGTITSLSTQIYLKIDPEMSFTCNSWYSWAEPIKKLSTVTTYDSFAVILGFEPMKNAQICGCCT